MNNIKVCTSPVLTSPRLFDIVKRPLLWSILSKFGCPPHFLAFLRELHDGMTAKDGGGHETYPFSVIAGLNKAVF